MKRIIILLSAIIFTSSAIAQIPNSGFEIWTSAGSYMTPTGWDNMDSMTSSLSVYSCMQGTPGSPGSYFLKLVSKNAGLGVVPGIAMSGKMNVTTMQPQSGFALASRPQSLTGSWQYMAYGSDQGFIYAQLTKWNTTTMKRDTVAVALQNLTGMVMAWGTFTINLNYLSGSYPDSALIILSASGASPVNNSYLYIDNLAFTGSVPGTAVANTLLNNSISVYPNPTKNLVVIESNNLVTGTKVQCIDVVGKIVKEDIISAGTNKYSLNIQGLQTGTYFVKISNQFGDQVQKLIVQ